ncbi:BRCA1-A complex subunit Abraxas 1 isoform X2 [Thalassophryne amazonica]|uniref:BRCA1-A complex subunit Abraxas 1 isoform X2 n=1 Tax=Thalassophryne amazonica TaxID=390379 RepID=UPI0014715606|nr:BRCA1-A complex subunit Abraxas 1 isoform X2 [Thalassophryne amazonica]
MAEPTVRVSGIVLASLLFHHINSDSDAEGFILGESKVEEQVSISDSQVDHIYIEEICNIQKHVACHHLNNFYNGAGELDLTSLQDLLARSQQERVIGWYRQRRNTALQMTFREKLVHEKLKTELSNPHMIFVLLTPTRLTSAGSTYSTEYTAFVSRDGHFMNVPVLVNNLGLLEQSPYWKVSTSCSASGFNLTMNKHGSKFFSSNGLLREVNEVNKMNDSLQSELQTACRAVEESERLVEVLQEDVSVLRRRLQEHQQDGRGDDDRKQREPEKNLLLHSTMKTLFTSSPHFHTHTLSADGTPVPDNSW